MQFLVDVGCRTLCLDFLGPISVLELKSVVFEREGLPVLLQRVFQNGKLLSDTQLLDGQFVKVLLNGLRGGKGGFGSLLRTAAHRIGHKKTTNYNACRDLNGRRLRHVDAEQKLAEWSQSEHKNNPGKLKKQYGHVKDGTKEAEACKFGNKCKYKYKCPYTHPEDLVEQQNQFDLTHMSTKLSADEDREDSRVSVEKAVQMGIKAAKERKVKLMKVHKPENSAELKEDGKAAQPASVSPNEQSERSKKRKRTESEDNVSSSSSSSVNSSSSSSSPSADSQPAPAPASLPVDEVKVPFQNLTPLVIEPLPEPPSSLKDAPDLLVPSTKSDKSEYAPIDLSTVANAAALEAFGLEHLKAELSRVGLKCGGSLTERANRLFLLKATPFEKIEAKFKAPQKPKDSNPAPMPIPVKQGKKRKHGM